MMRLYADLQVTRRKLRMALVGDGDELLGWYTQLAEALAVAYTAGADQVEIVAGDARWTATYAGPAPRLPPWEGPQAPIMGRRRPGPDDQA